MSKENDTSYTSENNISAIVATTPMASATPSALEHPLSRRRDRYNVYCAKCWKTGHPHKRDLFLKCSCETFRYCSTACQEAHLDGFHGWDCRILSRFHRRDMKVQYAGLSMKNEDLNYEKAYPSQGNGSALMQPPRQQLTLSLRAHTYERALDEYLERYEEIRAIGIYTDLGVSVHQDYVLIQPRIPFLLAVLGHDDLAMTEVAMTMDFSGKTGRIPRSRYDDILQALFLERNLEAVAWPVCFLLPVLLVKMRLTVELLQSQTFRKADCFPDDIRNYIASFLMDGDFPNEVILEQKRQMKIIMELLLDQDETIADFGCSENDCISYNFDGDYEYDDHGLFTVFRRAFLESSSMRNLFAELVRQIIPPLPEFYWERVTIPPLPEFRWERL